MIAADVGLREDLAICREFRIPHSEFLGWADVDQDKARAFHRYLQSVCGGCGTRPEEWDEKAGGHRHAYSAITDECPGCRARGQLESHLRQSKDDNAGVRIVLLPRAAADARARLVGEQQAARRAAEKAAT